MLKLRNAALVAAALFMLYNAISSGNAGSIVIAGFLSGICFFVVLTGKVHKKFTKPAAFKDASGDEAVYSHLEKNMNDLFGEELVRRVKSRLLSRSKEN